MKELTFGVIIGTRGFFNPELSKKGRAELIALLENLGYMYVILSEEDAPYGVVETYQDAKKCAKLFRDNSDKIDGILVSLPNFGDEVGVATSINLSKLDVPVLIQACDDDLDKLDLENRRDAFCGKLSVCNNLYQYGINFSNTSTHTCAIDSPEFTSDINFFGQVCRVVGGLKSARIAQIGTRPSAFQTVRYSEKILQKSGITVIPVDLSEIISEAKSINASSKKVLSKVEEIKNYGNIPSYIKEQSIIKSAKLNIAIEKFLNENGCVAGAVLCWTSIQDNYGCAACLPMSMIGNKGRPLACETDITGALSMYAMYLASAKPSGYLDWNNNFGTNRDKCINTHCSNFPKDFIGRDFEISNLDILGQSIGYDRCFGACKASIAPGNMTYAKITTDDTKGAIKAYFGEGTFSKDNIKTPGGRVVCKIDNLQKLLDFLCQNGFEHHVAMNRSKVAAVLNEAFSKYMGWDVYWHK